MTILGPGESNFILITAKIMLQNENCKKYFISMVFCESEMHPKSDSVLCKDNFE